MSYNFDENSPFPFYDGSQGISEPVSVEWNPSIYCSNIINQTGGYYDEINLPIANIAEIRVESIRAYHLLCRKPELQDSTCTVKILPPIPAKKDINDRSNIVVVVSNPNEYDIACSIAKPFNAAIVQLNDLLLPALESAGCVVFPSIKSATSALLCAAICEGCKIVSSDAGAAEEYLSNYAYPGSWHVVHDYSSVSFIGAINELQSQGDWKSINYCDGAPYGC